MLFVRTHEFIFEIKFRVIWDVTACSQLKWTNVSEVRTASHIRATR
jgi:hypothetical protein